MISLEMTAKEARQAFSALKEAILADGKVDIDEVNVLLAFTEGYIASERFFKFKRTLLKCKEDQKISEEESKAIAREIDLLSKFLTVEVFAEKLVIWCISALIVSGLAWVLLFR